MSHTFTNIEFTKRGDSEDKNEDSTSVFTIIDLASEIMPNIEQSLISEDKRFGEQDQNSLFMDATNTQLDMCGYNKKTNLQEYVRRNNIVSINQLYNYVDKVTLNSSNHTTSLLTQLLKQNFNTDYRIYVYTIIEAEKITPININCFVQLFEFTQNVKYKIGSLLVYRGMNNNSPNKDAQAAANVGNICDEISKTPTPLTSRGDNKEEVKSLSKQFELEDLSKIPANKFSNDNSEANPFNINSQPTPQPDKGFTFICENEQSKEITKDTITKSNRLAQGFAKLTESLFLTTSFFHKTLSSFANTSKPSCISCTQCKKDIRVVPSESACYMINRPFVYAPVFIRVAQQRKVVRPKLSPPLALSQISIPKASEIPKLM